MAALSALGPAADPQHPPLDGLGAVGSRREAAELLSSKLDLLKAELVGVQQQLRRRGEGRGATQEQVSEVTSCRTQQRRAGGIDGVGDCAQRPEPQPERPLLSRLKRSSSFQEILSSPRNKLLRQSSLQQQKVASAAVGCCLCCFFVLSVWAVVYLCLVHLWPVAIGLYSCSCSPRPPGVLFPLSHNS